MGAWEPGLGRKMHAESEETFARAVHFTWKWDRRTDYQPAAPCLAIEIVAGAASPVTLRDAPTVAVCSAPAMRSWF